MSHTKPYQALSWLVAHALQMLFKKELGQLHLGVDETAVVQEIYTDTKAKWEVQALL